VCGDAWGGYVSSGGTADDMVTLRFAKDSVPTAAKTRRHAKAILVAWTFVSPFFVAILQVAMRG